MAEQFPIGGARRKLKLLDQVGEVLQLKHPPPNEVIRQGTYDGREGLSSEVMGNGCTMRRREHGTFIRAAFIG